MGHLLLTAAADVDIHVTYVGSSTRLSFELKLKVPAVLLTNPLILAVRWHVSLSQNDNKQQAVRSAYYRQLRTCFICLH